MLRRLFAVASLVLTPTVSEAKPNILWICADDLAAYACGAYGGKGRTPNIDRLAASGTRFDRAYCNSPVCTASRQSFLTGRYPRTIGVTQLRTALPAREVTLATLLRNAGYTTAAIGKMHFNSALTHGFDLRVDMPDYRRWITQKGAQPLPEDIEVQPPWRPFKDPAAVWLNSAIRPKGLLDADMPATYLAAEAARFLRAKREQPFFLMVSFYEPHSPFDFPVEFAARKRTPGEFTAPKVRPADEWQVPAIFRNLTDTQKQGIAAAYYTSVEFLDRNVGVVLDALAKSGVENETLVIFIGDHGYMLGEHGRFEKHCMFEPAVRSPLVIRLPGGRGAGRATPALVEFIDIVPTVLEACGVPVPADRQGKSLMPVLTGTTDRHRDRVMIEYSENEEAAVRTEQWKLIYTTGQREREDGYTTGRPLPGRVVRLYDVVNDPEELTDLSSDSNHAKTVAELTTRLAEHMVRTARVPKRLPKTDDVHELLAVSLRPDDVKKEAAK